MIPVKWNNKDLHRLAFLSVSHWFCIDHSFQCFRHYNLTNRSNTYKTSFKSNLHTRHTFHTLHRKVILKHVSLKQNLIHTNGFNKCIKILNFIASLNKAPLLSWKRQPPINITRQHRPRSPRPDIAGGGGEGSMVTWLRYPSLLHTWSIKVNLSPTTVLDSPDPSTRPIDAVSPGPMRILRSYRSTFIYVA